MKQDVVHSTGVVQGIDRIHRIVDDEVLQQVLWERKKDRTNGRKRIFFWAVRHRLYLLCYLLLIARMKARSK